MRDLTHERADFVATERSTVATKGWGARLLALQAPDGRWGGRPWSNDYTDTFHVLELLRLFGLDPASEEARRAIGLVREHVIWRGGAPVATPWDDHRFFEGEVEPCINGRVLAIGAYFGEVSDRLVDRLLQEQLSDGGWNCYAPPSQRSSFNSTICVLEGLLEYETAKGPRPDITGARLRGQEYLLERRLFRSRSTGRIIKPAWIEISFPTRWHYDILWGMDYLRRAGVAPDDRIAEAIDLVRKKRDEHGRWPLENPHPGPVHFEMEGAAGEPSRWNTLRALRVLHWANAG
jgi:hypothetical protein